MQATERRFGGERATRYDAIFDARGTDGYSLRSRLAATLEALGDEPGVVLDAGMGPGRLCAALDARGWEVWGVDTSAEMVELARARVPAAAERLRVAQIEALPFEAGMFDAVAVTGALEYTELDRAVPELARVLRPGGVAALSYPNSASLYRRWQVRVHYPLVRAAKRLVRREDADAPRALELVELSRLRALLEAAGLTVERLLPSGYLVVLPPLDALGPRIAERTAERLRRTRPELAPFLATQVVVQARKDV